MPALANELARLIRPLHGSSPVAGGAAPETAAAVAGLHPNCVLQKTISARKGAPSDGAAYGGRSCQSQRRTHRERSPRPAAFVPSRGRDGSVRGTSRTRLHCSTGGREASVAAADHPRQDQARGLDAIPAARGARRRDGSSRLRHGRPPRSSASRRSSPTATSFRPSSTTHGADGGHRSMRRSTSSPSRSPSPARLFLTILGGFLFGWFFGGAARRFRQRSERCCVFLIARTSVGDILVRKAGAEAAEVRRTGSARTRSPTSSSSASCPSCRSG